MSIRASLIGRIVAASTRQPVIVLLLGVVLTGAALAYTAQHFALTADTSELISTKLKWRQNELAFDRAFPQFNNLTMIVVDGATPELADAAATRLTAALQAKPELFKAVRRPDGDLEPTRVDLTGAGRETVGGAPGLDAARQEAAQ